MGKIIAIGGGENGRPGHPYETAPFDKEAIYLTGKNNPNFLFIGLANPYPDSYYDVMCRIYNGMYECSTDHLTEIDIRNPEIVEHKVGAADIIYIGGGNTLRLMNLLRIHKIYPLIRHAYNKGTVLCGISAGAICFCRYGNSSSRKFKNQEAKQIRVKGLDILPILFCPHFNRDSERQASLTKMMKTTYRVPAIALDNAAIEIVDGMYRIIKIDHGAVAEKHFWKNDKYIVKQLSGDKFEPESELFEKK